LDVDVLIQNALQHKEHNSRFSCARDTIHSDGRSRVRESNNGEYEQTL
jgi:hypothetical protein